LQWFAWVPSNWIVVLPGPDKETKAEISGILGAIESAHSINDLCAASSNVPESGLASMKEKGQACHGFTCALMRNGKMNLEPIDNLLWQGRRDVAKDVPGSGKRRKQTRSVPVDDSSVVVPIG